ncbi:unnamed protein product [Malus baccata var. baccata]
METVVGNLCSPFLLSQFGNSRPCLLKLRTSAVSPVFKHCFTTAIKLTEPIVVQNDGISNNNILTGPICYDPFSSSGDPGLSVESASGSSFQCGTYKKTYFGNETHIDLTTASSAKNYGESMPVATEMLKTPLVLYLYERGWQFELTKDFLKPVLGGGSIIDASCWSGMFSRLFAKNGLFSLVVALDYSENMLNECYGFIQANISRLPFATGYVDTVHAGAAIQCWPSPSAAKMKRKSNERDQKYAHYSKFIRHFAVIITNQVIKSTPTSLMSININIHEHHSCQSASKASFTKL